MDLSGSSCANYNFGAIEACVNNPDLDQQFEDEFPEKQTGFLNLQDIGIQEGKQLLFLN